MKESDYILVGKKIESRRGSARLESFNHPESKSYRCK